MTAQVFSKARRVKADVMKRLSARGLRAKPASPQSLRVPEDTQGSVSRLDVVGETVVRRWGRWGEEVRGLQRTEGGDDNHLGARCDQLAERFGEGEIPADEQAYRTEGGLDDGMRVVSAGG